MNYLKEIPELPFKNLYNSYVKKIISSPEYHQFELDFNSSQLQTDENNNLVNIALITLVILVISLPILFFMALLGLVSGYHFVAAAVLFPIFGFLFYASESCK